MSETTFHLLNPDDCRQCPFHSLETVSMPDGGGVVHVRRCRRRDCDNWIREPVPLWRDGAGAQIYDLPEEDTQS